MDVGKSKKCGIGKRLALCILAAVMATSMPAMAYADSGATYSSKSTASAAFDINASLHGDEKTKDNKAAYYKAYVNGKTGKTIAAATACRDCHLLCEYVNRKARKGNGITLDNLCIKLAAHGQNKKASFAAEKISMVMKFDVRGRKANAKTYVHVLSYDKNGKLKSHTVADVSSRGNVEGQWFYAEYGVGVNSDGSNNTFAVTTSVMHIGDGLGADATAKPVVGGKVVVAVSASKKAVGKNDPRYTLSTVLSCAKGKSDNVVKAGRVL